MPDMPDWTRATTIQGQDGDGNPVTILLDVDGQMYVILRGQDAGGNPQTVKVDSDGQLYTVMRGASGYDVLVDSEGYMVTVLKGEYLGALHTISVDSEGRIEAFMLDHESQWGDTLQVGNADLAGRLGACKTWDWRGNVLFMNTFEYGLGNFNKATSGTGASVTITPDFAMFGGYSAKLIGGSDSNKRAHIYTKMGRNPTTGYGLEVAWATLSNYHYIEIQLLVAVGSTTHMGFLRHVRGDGKLYYYGDDAAYHNFATQTIEGIFNAFNFLKVVIDVDESKYIRCLMNSETYDLSAYALETAAIGNKDTVSVYVYCFSTTGDNYGFLVDHVILTGGES